MGFRQPTTVEASSAKTADGDTGSLAVPSDAISRGRLRLSLLVDVTAISGTTPTMDLTVEWSVDGTTFAPADPADAFTQIAAVVGAHVKDFTIKGTHYRVVWDVEGTSPSYTFSVDELAA